MSKVQVNETGLAGQPVIVMGSHNIKLSTQPTPNTELPMQESLVLTGRVSVWLFATQNRIGDHISFLSKKLSYAF